ncbi:recombination protein RecR [Pseudoclavibacter chungangensis]|nr:recombination protein RecR [Pseudoclavibacter chungangensis]
MYEGIVQDLIDELGRLPGVGPKSAQRIAFHIVQTRSFDVSRLAQILLDVRERVRFCRICGNVADGDECVVCRDQRRDPTVICVVEEPKDVAAIERTREFDGRYHVLGGAISPIDGIGPEELNIRSLLSRLDSGEVQEVIIATDPNLEGDATASYLSRLLSSIGVRVSRLASGLPVGGDLEYADEVTLGRAFSGRQTLGASRGAAAPPPRRPPLAAPGEGWAERAAEEPGWIVAEGPRDPSPTSSGGTERTGETARSGETDATAPTDTTGPTDETAGDAASDPASDGPSAQRAG